MFLQITKYLPNTLSVIASIIAIFTFMTGYGEISKILPDFTTIPLFRTFLSNQGWINVVVAICVVSLVEYIQKKNRFHYLRKVVSNEKSKWKSETKSIKIIRELMEIDRRYYDISAIMTFLIMSIFFMCIYYSNFMNAFSQRIFYYDIEKNTISSQRDKLLNKHEFAFAITNNGIILEGNSNQSLVHSLSIFPERSQSKNEKKLSIYKIKLPEHNIVYINNFLLFCLYSIIIYSVFLGALLSKYSFVCLVIIKKLAPDKYDNLMMLVKKSNFNFDKEEIERIMSRKL